MKKGCARWVLSRWNSVSRGQDENAFAISKCEHFSTWRSIHCEREMGPFRKIDWRCSSRYFRFLSLGSYVTTQLPFSPPFPSIEPPQMRTFITDFFFPFRKRGWGREKMPSLYIANHDSTRLLLDTRIRVGRMGSFKRIRQPTNRRILRFQIGSCGSCGRHFLFSFSPSNEQLRRNWINLDGEKFRAEEAEQPGENFIPSGVTRGHGFVLKGWISCFRSRGYRSFREIGHSYTGPLPRIPRITLRGGKKRKRPGAGLLKFSIVAPFPFGQEARLRKTESKYFEKIGSTEIRKSGPERNSCSSLGKRNRKVTRKRQTRREQVERKWRVAIMRFSHESPDRGNHSGRFRFDEFRWVNGESS